MHHPIDEGGDERLTYCASPNALTCFLFMPRGLCLRTWLIFDDAYCYYLLGGYPMGILNHTVDIKHHPMGMERHTSSWGY